MKKWLFILLISFFVFMPKDVFAKEMSLKPYQIDFYDFSGNRIAYTNGFTARNYANLVFYGADYNNTVSSVVYTFNPLSYIDTSKHYDFNFYIFQPNISQAMVSDYPSNNNVPLVSLGHTTCEVSSSSTIAGSSGNYTSAFSVKCQNVQLNQQAFTVDVLTPDFKANALTYPNYYAISSMFNISESFDYSAGDSLNGIKEEQEKTNEKLDDLNESITDSDISGASDSAGGFFTDFENDDYGLSDIVTLPLTFIQGLANASCSELSLPLPFVDEDVELPCMSAIYENYFGPFLTIYQIITFGIVGYWVCVNTLRLVNNFKNPDNDEVEVMDL